MTAIRDVTDEPGTTWVEQQHERLEAASDTAPAHLQLEDGVGAVFGGAIGLVVGLVVGGIVLALAAPVGLGAGALVLVVGGGLGVVGGAVLGAMTVGLRAHAAEAEFADLWAHARHERPVRPVGGAGPLPVEQGDSVFPEASEA